MPTELKLRIVILMMAAYGSPENEGRPGMYV